MTFEQLCGQMGDEAMIDIPYFLGELNAGQDVEVNHLTRSGRHYKPAHLRRETSTGKEDEPAQTQEDEEDAILQQLKRTQANISTELVFRVKGW